MNSNPYFSITPRGVVEDVFYNTFDITWAKRSPTEPPAQRFWTLLPIEAAEDDGSVTYTYNNDFFRSEDFTKEHVVGKHILFAGCSQTEGVGAPIDSIWPKVLLDILNTDARFYSIAKAGYGWQKIITNFMIYVDKYGAPDYLFVLLPNIGRFFVWDGDAYSYIQRYPNEKSISRKKAANVFEEQDLTEDEHKRSFVDFSISWKLFEKYCESIGTKILWSSWDYNENKNYETARVSTNYIPLSSEGLMSYVRSQRPDGKIEKFDLSRRDGHAGVLTNRYWAEEFKKEILNRGWKC